MLVGEQRGHGHVVLVVLHVVLEVVDRVAQVDRDAQHVAVRVSLWRLRVLVRVVAGLLGGRVVRLGLVIDYVLLLLQLPLRHEVFLRVPVEVDVVALDLVALELAVRFVAVFVSLLVLVELLADLIVVEAEVAQDVFVAGALHGLLVVLEHDEVERVVPQHLLVFGRQVLELQVGYVLVIDATVRAVPLSF